MLFVAVMLVALVGAAFWADKTGLVNGESLFLLPLGLMGGMLLYIFLRSRRGTVLALAGLSWNSKNVMPFADLDAGNYFMVIVKDSSLNGFLRNNRKNWLAYACNGKWLLLRQLS